MYERGISLAEAFHAAVTFILSDALVRANVRDTDTPAQKRAKLDAAVDTMTTPDLVAAAKGAIKRAIRFEGE